MPRIIVDVVGRIPTVGRNLMSSGKSVKSLELSLSFLSKGERLVYHFCVMKPVLKSRRIELCIVFSGTFESSWILRIIAWVVGLTPVVGKN
jgi:hypothetical protein